MLLHVPKFVFHATPHASQIDTAHSVPIAKSTLCSYRSLSHDSIRLASRMCITVPSRRLPEKLIDTQTWSGGDRDLAKKNDGYQLLHPDCLRGLIDRSTNWHIAVAALSWIVLRLNYSYVPRLSGIAFEVVAVNYPCWPQLAPV